MPGGYLCDYTEVLLIVNLCSDASGCPKFDMLIKPAPTRSPEEQEHLSSFRGGDLANLKGFPSIIEAAAAHFSCSAAVAPPTRTPFVTRVLSCCGCHAATLFANAWNHGGMATP